jgi:predicted CoA-binding protein
VFRNPDDAEIKQLLEGSRNVAVVGLSDRPYRTSHGVARALQGFGYRIFPVNPNLTGPVLGERPYASVEEIPEPVDIVDVFRRGQLGVVNEEAARYAEEHGLTVVMDRCLKVDHALLIGR